MLPLELPVPPLSCCARQPLSDSIELTESAYDGIEVAELVETLVDTLIVTSVTQAAPFEPHDFTCNTCVPVEEETLLLIV